MTRHMDVTTPENLVQQIDRYVKNPSTLIANAQGAWRDALDQQQPYTRWMSLKVANEYVLEGWAGHESFGHYVDSGLFHLYWKHERLALAVERAVCECVDDYLKTERELRSYAR